MKLILTVLLLTATASAIYDPLCLQPIERGPCRARELRFAYDPSEGKCVRFEYGGCQGNENNFKTQRECVRACMIKRSSERIVVLPPPRETTSIYIPIVPKLGYPKRCREPIDSGICHGYIPRFAFDERRGECISFIYGGCKGNRNRFQTRKECQQACLP